MLHTPSFPLKTSSLEDLFSNVFTQNDASPRDRDHREEKTNYSSDPSLVSPRLIIILAQNYIIVLDEKYPATKIVV